MTPNYMYALHLPRVMLKRTEYFYYSINVIIKRRDKINIDFLATSTGGGY